MMRSRSRWFRLSMFGVLYFVQGSALAYFRNFQKPYLDSLNIDADVIGPRHPDVGVGCTVPGITGHDDDFVVPIQQASIGAQPVVSQLVHRVPRPTRNILG